MIRKLFSLLCVVLAFGATSYAQTECGTHGVVEDYKKIHPEIAQYEKELNQYIAEAIKSYDLNRARAKGTFGPDDTLHIPVVVHVIHDFDRFGADYVSDDRIRAMIDTLNVDFLGKSAALSQVYPEFKPYIGNPKIKFHLATKDPLGRPTIGITRKQSYLTAGGDDQAKFDQWDPSSYINIWVIRVIGRAPAGGGVVLAYATPPATGAAIPYTDGILSAAPYLDNSGKTIPHEMGHVLNLIHPWGNVVGAKGDCTGDDEVDDTPPTDGHTTAECPRGDTTCTNNVVKLSKILLDSTLSPKVDSGIKGIDYIPRTNLVVEAVDIYPSTVGAEFEITHYKQNRTTGVFNVIDVLSTKDSTLAKTSLGSSVVTTSLDSPAQRSSIVFNTSKHLWLDSFAIYPTTIGSPFTIMLFNFNNDTVKVYNGTTNTASGAQMIPFSTFIPPANGYVLRIMENPGLKSDSITYSQLNSYAKTRGQAITITSELDTTGQEPGTAPGAYKGRYNYFYNWHVRFDALTTTNKGAQTVDLGYKVLPDTTFRLTVTKNPGLKNDSIGASPYVKSVPCVFDVLNETTNGRYDLLYSPRIRYGYIKNCIDYPDTVNIQNIMDYTACPLMFTKGQVDRMRATLSSKVANRNNLVKDTTHVRTGILTSIGGTYLDRTIDISPVPAFSVEKITGSTSPERTFFRCTGSPFYFKQRSWRDTIQSVEFKFNKGAANPTVNLATSVALNGVFSNTFSEPGWVDITITAKGNGTPDSTAEFKSAVYVADANFTINPLDGYYMEFNKADADDKTNMSRWPTFNYYNNDFKWGFNEQTGYYDKTCIKYDGFDNRTSFIELYTGSPEGDFDDFFTPAFDLSGMTGTECRLNFLGSGATRVTDSRLMTDSLEIAYSTDCGGTWFNLAVLTKADLANKGTVTVPYAPLWHGDWELKSFNVPMSARQSKVFFRFRYKPGADNFNPGLSQVYKQGTGNNYYIDRINISPYKLGVNTLLGEDKNIVLAPNPTNGSTQLIIRSASIQNANIIVTDVTGKVVFQMQEKLNGNINTFEIPASVISVKGVYMVHVQAGEQKFTEKLVSY